MIGRLGGLIEVKPGRSNMRGVGKKIGTNPHQMTDRTLKKNVCDGAPCRYCVCVDRCGYGQEAVKRGLCE